MKQLIIIILTLITSFSFAQEKDEAMLKSIDFVFDGNKLVSDDFVAAEKEYRKAISEKPSNTSGTYNLGNAYYDSGLYSEALLRHLETAKLATSKPEKHQVYHNIGNALMKQKLCKEAVEAFKNALRNDPTDEETRYNLVIAKECAEQQGDGGGGGDDDKEDEEKEDGEDKEDESKDKGEDEEDKNEGDDKEDNNGKPKDEKGDNEGDPKEEKKNQKPQPGKLSPQQVKNLLEAMNNQEKKVQEKINAKKVKGEKVKTEKDW
jgi:Ca-activated chloride channel family protein